MVPEVLVWVTRPPEADAPGLGEVGDEVRGLDHVSTVNVRTEGSVLSVSFEGGREEQEEIEAAIRRKGYEIFKVSYSET